ncbi:MAG: general secretion pathway protein GspK [Neomegalonema sp.]|nr:general secretion pathway protein GspK [Neomegalonema sp.]
MNRDLGPNGTRADRPGLLRERAGFGLVLALILCAGLAWLALSLGSSERAAARLAWREQMRIRTELALDAVLAQTLAARASLDVAEDPTGPPRPRLDPGLARKLRMGGLIVTRVPGEGGIGDILVRMRVMAANGLIDLNIASPQVLDAFYAAQGLSGAAIAIERDALLDWTDHDDEPRSFGLEAPAYRAMGLPEPGNRPLRSVAELAWVHTRSAPIRNRLAEMATIWGSTRVNPLSAPLPVLASLLGESAARRLIDLRSQPGMEASGLDATGLIASAPSGSEALLDSAQSPMVLIIGQAIGPGPSVVPLRLVAHLPQQAQERVVIVARSRSAVGQGLLAAQSQAEREAWRMGLQQAQYENGWR